MSIFEKIENTINLEHELITDEVITELDEERYYFSSFYRVGENKKIHKDVYGYLRSSCLSCGLIDWTRPDEEITEEFRMKYHLKLAEMACHSKGIHFSIFKEMCLDAISKEKKIFNITQDKLGISRIDNIFPDGTLPILTLKYDSYEAMLLDMITAANYIKENLDAGKNRDN